MSVNKLLKTIANVPKMTTKRPFRIAIEGNVGSGKTTFLNHLKSLDNGSITVLSEPVELWRDCNGHNLLSLLYEDPTKWGFTFQSYVQLTMLNNHMQKVDTPIKIMERSIFSARYCFVEKMKSEGILPQPSFAVVDAWYQWLCSNKDLEVDMFVYLRTSPEVAYKRVLERNRKEEKTVPLEYLQSLHVYHENWLFYKTLQHCPANVITINADSEFSVVEKQYSKFCQDILSQRLVALEV